jgi:hypothetical protein
MNTYELLNFQMEGGAVGAPLQAVPARPIPLPEVKQELGPALIQLHRMEGQAVFLAVELLLLTLQASKLRLTQNLATAPPVRLLDIYFSIKRARGCYVLMSISNLWTKLSSTVKLSNCQICYLVNRHFVNVI